MQQRGEEVERDCAAAEMRKYAPGCDQLVSKIKKEEIRGLNYFALDFDRQESKRTSAAVVTDHEL
jgi:hypothetical protein